MVLNKLSYHHRLFLLLLAFSWLLVACFIAFQYDREKDYKALQLNDRLQLYNRQLLDAIDMGKTPVEFISSVKPIIEDVRVSVIDIDGNVVFDNILDSYTAENHFDRPEVIAATRNGTGYTVRRHSRSTDGSYFYSAMREGDTIVRSAVPYSVGLSQILAADKTFLWFMGAVTLIMSVVAWFATRRIGRTVARLNSFAARAEKGERIYDDESFPTDELGSISHHIITLYAQRERQHEEAMRQEQEKIRIKKQLTNNINHELKTPLAAMQVCLETLMNHPKLTNEQKEMFIKRCYANSERLKELLADISTLTRLDDGREVIETEVLSLNGVIKEICEEMSGAHMLPIVLNLEDDVMIEGNRSLLSAVFGNLIRNANNYSLGTRIDVTMRCNPRRGYVTICLSDDGIGIPEIHLPHIFERFYRIDKGRSRANGGTGLGLSIVKNAVLFHHGTITASNLSSGGLGFTITLPVTHT